MVAGLVSRGLPPREIEATEDHLDGCAACRELVARALRELAVKPALADLPRIGRYRLLREVGSGGMGRVYAAEDPELGREIALKVLHPVGHEEAARRRTRWRREACAMARLTHPNVIVVHEIGTADEQLFIAMELVKGASLRRWLDTTPRGWRAVADVLCAAGRGLAAAHAAGVVHRDFKPDNVLVGDDERVRVTDFGLAQLVAIEATLPAGAAAAELTSALALGPSGSGAIVGTPAYMAPEQRRGVADERSDLFSFCVTFWEALHGEHPFAGRDLRELAEAVAAGAVRPPPEGRDVPAPLRDVIRRGLQPAPGDRPASMAQLLEAIEATVAAVPPAPLAGLTGMFGRARELARAEAALRRARAGSGSLLLVTGEAGIGKSRLAREVAALAAASGMRALWGRAWEAGGAMPYWPWVQIFRELGVDPLGVLTPNEGEISLQGRVRLFDAAARALAAAARREPLAILLEDLHAADLPSLRLLRFVAQQLGASPILLLATTRELEPRAVPELADALAKLGREGEAISLARLGRDDVAAWVAGRASSAGADEVYRITEGNPLFVEEVLRLGGRGRHLAPSDGIRAVLDAHLALLAQAAPSARALLEVAAVVGRQFGSRELAALAARPHEEVLAALDPACALGVIEAVDAEQLQFTHVLLRERLHQALPVARRHALHWKAGLAAEASGANAAACAHHLLEGVDAGDAEHAARAALRAAEQAIRQLAFESAIALGERALAVLPATPSLVACALERTVGEAHLRSGAIDAGHAHCLRAAAQARALGAPDELARAAIAYAHEQLPLTSDPTLVQLLEEARVALGPTGDELEARLGARLSVALLQPRTEADLERILRHAGDALAVARRIGDLDTLLYVLQQVRAGASYIMSGDQRFELIREIATLAEARREPLIYIRAAPDYAMGLLERGLRTEADTCLATLAERCAAHDSASTRWRLPVLRAAFALFDGDADGSERFCDEALAIAAGAGTTPVPMLWSGNRIAVAIASGDPARIRRHAELVLARMPRHTWVTPFRSWVLAAMGRRDEAAALLEQLIAAPYGFQGRLITAEACKILGHREAAGPLYRQTMGHCAGVHFGWSALGVAFMFGPAPRLLGELALLAGDAAGARRHFEESVALCRRIGARPFLERSLAALEGLDQLDANVAAR